MVYPFMTLDDGTEIVHSETKQDGRVKVYIEKPDPELCFRRATCWLPAYTWEDIEGFDGEQIERYDKLLHSMAHLIMEFAENGGFEYAAGF